ncbi:hypothetical protein QYE76_013678 [Lolium multiflorum]|uniref:Uncharacterized protein n=1 Tax=Lolium multiflorum TaxID=4521 RepID=A0AAD8TZB1_LOLMU|nr:hypothetical protein QYE76_013678 [Lolium multiflorum]
MAHAAALLLWLLLIGSLNLAASLLDFPSRLAEDRDVIGIDLGATYSHVAVYQDGHVVVLPNEEGNRATPSQVAFINGGRRLVGEAAKDQLAASTIYGAAKRLLGRRFSDEAVQRVIELLPFAVVDKGERPYVRVPVGGGGDDVLVLRPEEIVAEVLAKLKGTAEAFLGRKVTKAVITVPAYYNDAQRQATRDAGVIAGLKVVRMINDPSAAAIAYGLDKGYDKKTLVFDLGGGTFDVTVLLFEEGVFEVLSISGDSHLGGEDFDQRVTDHFVEVIKQKHGRDITGDSRAMQRLRRECERAKRTLSNQHQERVEVEALFDGVDFSEPLTRAQFEELNEDLFLKAMAQLQKAMADAGLDMREIDHIILAGGSTRIPKVQQLVKDYFDGKEPLRGINPDEAIAFGAAAHGSYLAGHDREEPHMNRYWSWSEPAIGIETDDGKMTPLIPRNPTLPTKKTHVLTTFWDKRSTVGIKVFQGDRSETQHCRLLGQLELSDIPTARRDIEVTMEVAEEYVGKLRVEATDQRSGKSESVIIYHGGRLSPEEIARMVREGEAWQARDELEAYMRSITDGVDGKMEPEEAEKLEEAVSKAREWLDINPVAEKEDYEKNLRELAEVCDPVVLDVHQRFLRAGRDDDEL